MAGLRLDAADGEHEAARGVAPVRSHGHGARHVEGGDDLARRAQLDAVAQVHADQGVVHQPQRLAKIIRSWAHEIAHIFHEEHLDILECPSVEMGIDHLGLEVAASVGVDLPDRRPAARQALRVVVRLQIADQCCHPHATLVQRCEGPFEESRLSCSRTRHEVHHKNTGGLEPCAQAMCQLVILAKNAGTHGNDARRGHGGGHAGISGAWDAPSADVSWSMESKSVDAPSSISRPVMSNSRPLRISPLGVSQTGQRNRLTPGNS